MMGRAWPQLERCTCSLWFLARCIQEFGVHTTRESLDSVAAAASSYQVAPDLHTQKSENTFPPLPCAWAPRFSFV